MTRVCVVGGGTHFLSGISYYTIRLVNAMAVSFHVSAIFMRQLIPTRWYPGRAHVGANLTELRPAESVTSVNDLDWHWWPGMVHAIAMLRRTRPEVLVFQWWTASVLHSYLLLAVVGRMVGARLIVEFHEVLDTGEERIPVVRWYVRLVAPLFMRQVDGFVVHSDADAPAVDARFGITGRPVAVIPHGPYDHHVQSHRPVLREAPTEATNLLYFGVIRPFKGLEDLIEAFNRLPPDAVTNLWLTVVGEPWEGWDLPAKLIADSRYRERISFIDRYVPDAEVAGWFAGADLVVLPYHRSSASGPLHIAMSHGLPVIVTAVGGLIEATQGYAGAVTVPPRDIGALGDSILTVAAQPRMRYEDPHSWERSVERYEAFITQVLAGSDEHIASEAS